MNDKDDSDYGRQKRPTYRVENHVHGDGTPGGGVVVARGLQIQWQDVPQGPPGMRIERNDQTTVEAVLIAARQRLEFFQDASERRYACRENALAITKIEEAIHWLEHRTRRRVAEGKEGTAKP